MTDAAPRDDGPEASADERPPDASEVPDDLPRFEDLTVLQRVFVAAVQNPTRGVVILLLAAFAFSFYVAFWLVVPRAAFLFTAFVAVVAVVALALYGLYRLVGGRSDDGA